MNSSINLDRSFCLPDAKVEEKVELRVFNHDFKASKAKMLEILKEANLEAHGYTKEVVSEIKDTSSGVVTFEKMHRYYKSAPCHEVAEMEKQLDALLGGNYSDGIYLEGYVCTFLWKNKVPHITAPLSQTTPCTYEANRIHVISGS